MPAKKKPIIPDRRKLLSGSTRVAIHKLTPEAEDAHFQHLAEYARMQEQLDQWLARELRKHRIDSQKEVDVSRAADEPGPVRDLLTERDQRQVDVILDVAGIRGKRVRQTVLRASAELQERMHSDNLEGRVYAQELFRKLEEERILEGDSLEVFKKAFWDWINARHFFAEIKP